MPTAPDEGARDVLTTEQHRQLDELSARNRVVRPLLEELQRVLSQEGDLTITFDLPEVETTAAGQIHRSFRPGDRTMVVIEGSNAFMQPYLDALNRVYNEQRSRG